MEKIDEISVFFPAYNEEENIEKTVKNAISVLDKVAKQFEIIVVNDGSKDKTSQVAEQIAKQNPNVKVINHLTNLGYGSALRSGFYAAKYDPVVIVDSDGQFDISEIDKLIAASTTADLVIGYRIKRMDPPIRSFIAWVWKTLIFIFLGFKVRDVDCGFKMVTQKVLRTIPKLESTVGGMINPELLIKATNAGFTFTQVGLHHYPRVLGKANGVGPKKVIISLFELLKLSWKLRVARIITIKTSA